MGYAIGEKGQSVDPYYKWGRFLFVATKCKIECRKVHVPGATLWEVDMDEFVKLLPFLWPVFALQLGLQVYCLISLVQRAKVRYNNKLLWGFIILCGGILGPIVYLLFRGDEF